MANEDGLTTLIAHNGALFSGKRLLVVGDIPNERVLAPASQAASCTAIADNYLVARRLAAALGQELGPQPRQRVSHGSVTLHFADLTEALTEVPAGSIDTVLLFLPKHKRLAQEALPTIAALLDPSASPMVYAAGENSAGGRSAGSLLKALGEPFKADLRRKCTLFAVKATGRPAATGGYAPVEIPAHGLTLAQAPGIFSEGRLDEGTALLISLLPQQVTGRALDLGCGSGALGLCLARLGAKSVTFSDVSARALALAARNARDNGIGAQCEFIASDGLSALGTYDTIAVNPPFHEGTRHEESPAQRMIEEAPAHLSPDGSLYLVGNSFLNYERALRAAFPVVDVLEKGKSYHVFRARKR
ncbi:MAG: methyltransferase [Succinivibrionaceae bacterium]|nr:methyltransferase [Succinivibrionaceae bacterium]